MESIAENLESMLPELQEYVLPTDMDHINDAYNIIKGNLKELDSRYWLNIRLTAIYKALKFSEEYNKKKGKKNEIARELLTKAGCYIQLATLTN